MTSDRRRWGDVYLCWIGEGQVAISVPCGVKNVKSKKKKWKDVTFNYYGGSEFTVENNKPSGPEDLYANKNNELYIFLFLNYTLNCSVKHAE